MSCRQCQHHRIWKKQLSLLLLLRLNESRWKTLPRTSSWQSFQHALHLPRRQRCSQRRSDDQRQPSRTDSTANVHAKSVYVSHCVGFVIVQNEWRDQPLLRSRPSSPAPIQPGLRAVVLGSQVRCVLGATPGSLQQHNLTFRILPLLN